MLQWRRAKSLLGSILHLFELTARCFSVLLHFHRPLLLILLEMLTIGHLEVQNLLQLLHVMWSHVVGLLEENLRKWSINRKAEVFYSNIGPKVLIHGYQSCCYLAYRAGRSRSALVCSAFLAENMSTAGEEDCSHLAASLEAVVAVEPVQSTAVLGHLKHVRIEEKSARSRRIVL